MNTSVANVAVAVVSEELCATCGAALVQSEYGIDRNGLKYCYACCAERDRQYMRDHGKITLYLTIPSHLQIGRGEASVVWRATGHAGRYGNATSTARTMVRDGVKIVNWSSSLSFTPQRLQWSVHRLPHGDIVPRYDVWFVFDGDTWHGVSIGNNTELLHCWRNKKIQRKPRKHYIAGAGLHGYLYHCMDVFETKTDAATFLGAIHDLSGRAMNRLRRDMYLELDLSEHGNEYCEITECHCDDPGIHSENGEVDF